MRTICFFVSKISGTGGTERVTSLIANELCEKGYQVYLFSLIGKPEINFELNQKIKIISLNLPEGSVKQNFIKIVLEWRKFIIEHKIDVVVDVDAILSVFSVCSLVGLKTKHISWEHFNYNVDLGVRFRRWGRILASRFADKIVTLTDKDRKIWQNSLKNIKAEIVTIHNPSPYENLSHTPKLEFKTILAVGRFTYQKGFDQLIEIWSQICKKTSEWRLVIVGEGEDKPSLLAKAKELKIMDYIEFYPATKDIHNFYLTSSFYCMTSRFEGLPMVLLEAQAFGLPIIAFDCECGPSDIVIPKKNGYLVRNGDLSDFENKLWEAINLSSHDYNSYSRNALENNKIFSLENNIISKWIDIIEN